MALSAVWEVNAFRVLLWNQGFALQLCVVFLRQAGIQVCLKLLEKLQVRDFVVEIGRIALLNARAKKFKRT